MMVVRYSPVDSLSSLHRNSHFMNITNTSKPVTPDRFSHFSNPFQESMALSNRDALSDLPSMTKPSSRMEAFGTTTSAERLVSEDEFSLRSHDPSRTSSSSSAGECPSEHIVHLSSIEHCMPRAYIRVCLAYAIPDPLKIQPALTRLRDFIRRTIDAKPYLAGFVTLSKTPGRHVGQVEVRFTTQDFLNYPEVEVKHMRDANSDLVDYSDLDAEGFPPSRLRPEVVSMLPPDVADEDRAPVLRVQANIVQGGMIVSFYLHHCISDGKGLGSLVSGDVLKDEFTFQRHLDPQGHSIPSIESRLHAFAKQQSAVRQKLSWSDPNQINTRVLQHKTIGDVPSLKNKPGRGCILLIPRRKLTTLVEKFTRSPKDITVHSIIMAVLWRHMTRARRPSISQSHDIKTSKLLIPVDIRKEMKEKLSDSYFGAAVDFAKAELDLDKLVEDNDDTNIASIARIIRNAIEEVDEAYVRQAIALAQTNDTSVDVRDLQASNMDRVNGADMYITSWSRLPLYDASLDMGIGKPDWVRKPWSRDPGSCIILPSRGSEPEHIEVVVQMAEVDMERLLSDGAFMEFVSRVID